MSTTIVSKRIKEARKKIQITQEELASAIGISDKSISAYESDRIEPPLQVLEKIAAATKQPLRFFIEDTIESAILSKLADVETQLKEIQALLKE
ncbi:MAG: helix-turn-helix transcriptional regulator [Candidatus Woesebacteria bacterium]